MSIALPPAARSALIAPRWRSYVVAAPFWSVNGSTLGLGLKVQSARAPWHVEARADAFLRAFRATLAALAPAALATHKRGLLVKLRERAQSLGDETARFWARVRAGDCDFLRRECPCSFRILGPRTPRSR